jgi:hypothetical protein
VDDYRQWLKLNSCGRFATMDTITGWDLGKRALGDCIAYDPEFGLPGVLALQPLSCPDWTRHDNPIDYSEETFLTDGSQEDRVELLRRAVPAGIWPFTGIYMDDRTGNALPHDVIQWVRLANAGTVARLRSPSPGLADELARRFGYADHQDALDHVVPVVPEEIRDLAAYAELFADPDAWKQLRPMIYTWWA